MVVKQRTKLTSLLGIGLTCLVPLLSHASDTSAKVNVKASPKGSTSDALKDHKPLPLAGAKVAKLQKLLNAMSSFDAHFTQSYHHPAIEQSSTAKGRVRVERPGRLRWDYEGSDSKSYIIHGEQLWLVSPDDKVVMSNPCFRDDQLSSSMAFLWGDEPVEKTFDLRSFPGQFGEAGDINISIRPKKSSEHYEQIILVVDADFKRLKQSVLMDVSGGANRFAFAPPGKTQTHGTETQLTNKATEQTPFSLNDWKDLEVVPFPGSQCEVRSESK